jgi:hypothetical protein
MSFDNCLSLALSVAAIVLSVSTRSKFSACRGYAIPITSPSIEQEIKRAVEMRDPVRLDLALRTEVHYLNRGRTVDTTRIRFPEVLDLCPMFYEDPRHSLFGRCTNNQCNQGRVKSHVAST